MKTSTIIVSCISYAAVISSCGQGDRYEHAELFSRQDFKSQQLLNGVVLTFDSLIMQPDNLYIYDSILVTSNPNEKKMLHIFNLNNKQKIGECLSKGEGPDEMIIPSFVDDKDSVKIYDIMTAKLFTYNLAFFIQQPNPNLCPTSIITCNKQSLGGELAQLGEKYIGISFQSKVPCTIFSLQGEIVKEFGSYPESTINYTDTEIPHAYMSLLTSNRKDKIAITHFFTDLIDIFDQDGILIKRLHGPEHFFSHFKEYRDGDIISVKAKPGTYKDAYYSPVNAGDRFFVLYNGKNIEEKGYTLLAQEIFVFDWNGTPLQHFTLDQGISRMAVDPQKQKIYGISNEPEYHILEFDYDAF